MDAVVAAHITELSRSQAAARIREETVRVDGQAQKPSYKVKYGEEIEAIIPAPAPLATEPEAIALDIAFEDHDLLVVNKPPGLVIHPSAGHTRGTLVNALLYHCPDLAGIGGSQRPGIVHRLDKDTSGLVVVAKNDHAHQAFSRQFKERQISKTYQAVVFGNPVSREGVIDLPVGRHPIDRKRMTVAGPRGRNALTLWRVQEYFKGAAWLEFDLKTGRTHQIRVHCQAIGHPIVGDPVYGATRALRRSSTGSDSLRAVLGSAARQMLHAFRIGFVHPRSGEWLVFEAALPRDMQEIIQRLRLLSTDERRVANGGGRINGGGPTRVP